MSYILLRTPRDIGLLIRDARKRAKLDQAELAVRLGVSRKWVVEAERGNAGAAIGTVLRALDVLGAKVGAIASDADTPRRKPAAREPEVDIDAIIDAARKRRR
jgi:HTH-type transcriptional regulator / antitoxin HipB